MQAFSNSLWKKEAVDTMNSILERLKQRGASRDTLLAELDNIAAAIEAAASEVSDLGSANYVDLLSLYFQKFPLFPSKPKDFNQDIDNYRFLVAKALRLSAICQNGNEAAIALLQRWGINEVKPNNYRVLAGKKQQYIDKFRGIAADKPSTNTADLFEYLADNL